MAYTKTSSDPNRAKLTQIELNSLKSSQIPTQTDLNSPKSSQTEPNSLIPTQTDLKSYELDSHRPKRSQHFTN